MRVYLSVLFSFMASAFISCGTSDGMRGHTTASDSTHIPPALPLAQWQDNGITLSLKEDSPEFPDAKLRLTSPSSFNVPPGKVKFSYTLSNYELTAQTAGGGHCANSRDGQHIHVILNNEPYLARYTTEFEEELKDGHYVCLSFLSRSYHESIKNGKAYQLTEFMVGNTKQHPYEIEGKPLMFYSRPKGEYVGADAMHLLLDFFLVNCELSPTGYKVNLIVNDSAHFTLTKWAPYIIEGMPMGENTMEMELVDSHGNRVENPFNPVRRTIVLKEA